LTPITRTTESTSTIRVPTYRHSNHLNIDSDRVVVLFLYAYSWIFISMCTNWLPGRYTLTKNWMSKTKFYLDCFQ